jgi:biopolymer transport protein ExbD
MASIDNGALGSKRSIQATPRIDMTPMVDLGFLLITFFIFTTSLSQQQAMRLFMPKGNTETGVKESSSLTVLLSEKAVYAYQGRWQQALKEGRVQRTTLGTFTGLGAAIRTLQERLRTGQGRKADELVLLIKPGKTASYNQIIDALDQATIHLVKHYAIVEPDAGETAFMKE